MSLTSPLRALVPRQVKARLRPAARRMGLAVKLPWWEATSRPRLRPAWSLRRPAAWCNVCDWSGQSFEGTAHAESATCPQCGSIARDRFLFSAFSRSVGRTMGLRVLETSPRLGTEYRTMMRRQFDYRCSDYDLSLHRADIALDLQNIDLPDGSVDRLITPHVLEHVPDVERALAGIHRLLAPGGRMYLQVPLLQGTTGKPTVPEFHADNTPVHWRFGWDLTERLRAAGFSTTVLITADFYRMLARPPADVPPTSPEFDLASMIRDADVGDLTPMLRHKAAARLGLLPAFQFVAWECIKP